MICLTTSSDEEQRGRNTVEWAHLSCNWSLTYRRAEMLSVCVWECSTFFRFGSWMQIIQSWAGLRALNGPSCWQVRWQRFSKYYSDLRFRGEKMYTRGGGGRKTSLGLELRYHVLHGGQRSADFFQTEKFSMWDQWGHLTQLGKQTFNAGLGWLAVNYVSTWPPFVTVWRRLCSTKSMLRCGDSAKWLQRLGLMGQETRADRF